MSEMIVEATCVDCKKPIPPTPVEEIVFAFTKRGKPRGEVCASCAAKADRRGQLRKAPDQPAVA